MLYFKQNCMICTNYYIFHKYKVICWATYIVKRFQKVKETAPIIGKTIGAKIFFFRFIRAGLRYRK